MLQELQRNWRKSTHDQYPIYVAHLDWNSATLNGQKENRGPSRQSKFLWQTGPLREHTCVNSCTAASEMNTSQSYRVQC